MSLSIGLNRFSGTDPWYPMYPEAGRVHTGGSQNDTGNRASAGVLSDLTATGQQAGQDWRGWLDQRPPQAAQDDRFGAGLSRAEMRLEGLLKDPNSIQQSNAYKFRVGQGQEAINRNLAAKGMLGSGNRLQELTKYGQDMASQEYDNQFSRLSGLLGNYSQGYTADKGANTDRYQAESNAWNQRGKMLSDLFTSTNSQRVGAAGNASDKGVGGAASYGDLLSGYRNSFKSLLNYR